MISFGFMNLFGLICLIFPCQGVVYPPSGKESLTFLPGSTGKIEWSFDDNISDVFSRSWTFTSTGSVTTKVIATLSDDGDPTIRLSFPVIAVEKPSTLVLNNVDHRYDGKYRFQVQASTGESFSEITVFIAEKPNVTLNCSSPVPLLKGANFTCLCRGEGGNPPANVTWFKNGEKFTDVGTEMQTLNLLNVSREDNGTYTCNATSYPHKNYTDEYSIQVTVYSKPNVSINCSSPINVNEGDHVRCDCKCKDGTPPANCTWYKNSTQIGEIGKEMKTLNLTDVTKEDSGIYTCVGKSNVIAQDENSIKVTVYYKPVGTTIKFSSFPIVFNQSLTVTCLSSGLPDPNITILHNDTKVASGMTYYISRVNRTHAGTYKCVANNYLGNDSFSIFLRVNDANTWQQEPESSTQQIKSSKDSSTLSSTASMRTNSAATTSCTPLCTTTCTPTCTSTPPTENSSENKQEDCNSGTEWYIILVTLISGIIIGIIFTYVVFRVRRENRKSKLSNPGPQTPRLDQTYQELDLKKMSKEDNYQSLRVNAVRNNGVNDDESNYTELKKARDVENNYQSLT